MNLSYVLVVLFVIAVFIFCEYLIYYSYLKQCSWPELTRRSANGTTEKIPPDQVLRVALITDVHLLGSVDAYWIDKVRREWQLTRSYRTLVELHKPEIVFVLGDLFDEGRFSSDQVFSSFVGRFFTIFRSTNGTQVYPLFGNHDIGYHNETNPHLVYRFSASMKVPLVELVSRKNVSFVLVNSVTMEQDGCHMCNETERSISHISSKLRCTNETEKCSFGMSHRPILLQHYPLYRENDKNCHEPDEAPHREKYTPFIEKWDCLSKNATEFLLEELNPRVVFDGHTHHGCHTLHKEDIHEYTVSSFNLRYKPYSRFIMAAFTENDYQISKCDLPHDYLINGIYVCAVIAVILGLYYKPIFRKSRQLRTRRYLSVVYNKSWPR